MSAAMVAGMSGPPPGILDIDSIAKLLGVTPKSVRGYVADGRAPEPNGRIGQSPWWFEATITEWLAKRPGSGGHNRSATIKSVLGESE